MDGYPQASIAPKVPLIVVSGLSIPHEQQNDAQKHASASTKGLGLLSQLPTLDTPFARALASALRAHNARSSSWRKSSYQMPRRATFRLTGREYILPPRHVLPSPSLAAAGTVIASKSELHSPLSPLSPGSSVHPDGLLSSDWFEKHQQQLPCMILSVYAFSASINGAAQEDEVIQTDLGNIKRWLGNSGYRTRLGVIFLIEDAVSQQTNVEERVQRLRRHIDARNLSCCLTREAFEADPHSGIEAVISSIFPNCVEYYKDGIKHARRKKNRGSGSAGLLTGVKPLTAQGWQVRYAVKMAAFAEFGGDPTSAFRAYETAYDILLGDDVLRATPNWSNRWNEGRLLADILAIRMLCCLFWTDNNDSAVQRWQLHRLRVKELVDQRGKGTHTYSWQAWETRWATLMADLIEKIEVSTSGSAFPQILTSMGKGEAVEERSSPWHNLHHSGYWLRMAVAHRQLRASLARAIPADDRQATNKSSPYETYLCPPPSVELSSTEDGVNHEAEILGLINRAMKAFEIRGQQTVVQELKLQQGKEYLKQGMWHRSLEILKPLWRNMTYRRDHWWKLVEEICLICRDAADKAKDIATVSEIDWELLHEDFQKNYGPVQRGLPTTPVNAEAATRHPIVVCNEAIHSFLDISYVFASSEVRAGDSCRSQLCIYSHARQASIPLLISQIDIVFDDTGGCDLIRCSAKQPDPYSAPFLRIAPREDALIPRRTDPSTSATSRDSESPGTCFQALIEGPLLLAAGNRITLEIDLPYREAGVLRATAAIILASTSDVLFSYTHKLSRPLGMPSWRDEQGHAYYVPRAMFNSVTILPKPPKLRLGSADMKTQFYTDEELEIKIPIHNDEEADCIASIEISLQGVSARKLVCLRTPGQIHDAADNTATTSLGLICSGASTHIDVIISHFDNPSQVEVVVKASYSLVSDPKTQLNCEKSMPFEITAPFEASYEVSPRVHTDPWPSLFDAANVAAGSIGGPAAKGLPQRWCLTARYASFAIEDLRIKATEVVLNASRGDVQCSIMRLDEVQEDMLVSPKTIEEAYFNIVSCKQTLDDRSNGNLDLNLVISWQRASQSSSSPVNRSVLSVPRMQVASSEPRVLAALSYSKAMGPLIHLELVVENPSSHLLTFGVSMESSESFGFSGTQSSTIQLVPLSREILRFRLLAYTQGDWLGPIKCMVRDKYFQKTLKILPTEGMKMTKEGLLLWVPPEDDD